MEYNEEQNKINKLACKCIDNLVDFEELAGSKKLLNLFQSVLMTCKNGKRITDKDLESFIESIRRDIIYNDDKYKLIINEVIGYLNQKLNSASFKPTSKNTITLIKARLNEGFTKDDLIRVIDYKFIEWKGTNMEMYIRPQTLFSTNCRNYLEESNRAIELNANPKQGNIQSRWNGVK